jgi:SAM-dependent methyltransferase
VGDRNPRPDFGYSLTWQFGHLFLALFFAGITAALVCTGWSQWASILTGLLGAWALLGWVIMYFLFRAHDLLTLPTAEFLPGGEGSVLDLGCGAGRTSIMIGQARPKARVTAIDDFSAGYISDHSEARLQRNLVLTGVAKQVTVQRANMLDLPFEDGSFDAAVSSYALDHLQDQIPRGLAEAHRVLRPGGQLLLMVILPGPWTHLAFPGLVALHFPARRRWHAMLQDANLVLIDEGTSSRGGWFLVRRPTLSAESRTSGTSHVRQAS